TRQRLVNRVVQYFEYHVVQAGAVACIAYVHARPLAHGIKPFQDFDAVRTIGGRTFVFLLASPVFFVHFLFLQLSSVSRETWWSSMPSVRQDITSQNWF